MSINTFQGEQANVCMLKKLTGGCREDEQLIREMAAVSAGVPDLESLLGDGVAKHWRPFTAELEEVGVAKKEVNAAMLRKLNDAGFVTLLDVRLCSVRSVSASCGQMLVSTGLYNRYTWMYHT